MRRIRVGLVGHRFMGKAHSHALRDLGMFFPLDAEAGMEMLCGIEDDLEETARRYGWGRWTRSWREVVQDPQIDVVAICTPGNTHCEIAVAACEAGKHVICEKPLAMDLAQARQMCVAARRAGVKHVVNFNYRRTPAVALARKLILDERLGRILFFHGSYFQDWPLDPEFPYVWRMDKQTAGAGSMADKGSHIVDLARFLVGEFAEVSATTEIFVRQRPGPNGEPLDVTTDDAAVFTARFQCGALGMFGTSRMAAGHKNSLYFEVQGSKGSVRFNLERMNELQVYFAGEAGETEGFRTVLVTNPAHRYVSHWWPPGHVLGWEHTFVHQYYELMRAILENSAAGPDFVDGMKAQAVLESIETAARENRWVAVED